MNIQTIQKRFRDYDQQRQESARQQLVAMAGRFATLETATDDELATLDLTLAEAEVSRSKFVEMTGVIAGAAILRTSIQDNPSKSYDAARQGLDRVLAEQTRIQVADSDAQAQWRQRREEAMGIVATAHDKLQKFNMDRQRLRKLETEHAELLDRNT